MGHGGKLGFKKVLITTKYLKLYILSNVITYVDQGIFNVPLLKTDIKWRLFDLKSHLSDLLRKTAVKMWAKMYFKDKSWI